MIKKKEVPSDMLFCDNINLSKDKNIRNNQIHGGGLPFVLRNHGVDTRDFNSDAPKIIRKTDDTYQTNILSRW